MFTAKEKEKFIEAIKSLDLHLLAITDEEKREWYKFGAYDALRLLTMKVLEEENVPTPKTKQK